MNETQNTSPRPQNRRRKLLLVSGIVGALAVSSVAVAGPGFGGRGGFGRLFKMIQRLDLTEEQEVLAVRLHRQIRAERKEIRQGMKGQMQTVIAELEKENPDPAKLHGMADQITAQMNKSMHGTIDKYLQLHSTLSESQRKEMVDTMRQHMDRSKKRRGRRGKRGRFQE